MRAEGPVGENRKGGWRGDHSSGLQKASGRTFQTPPGREPKKKLNGRRGRIQGAVHSARVRGWPRVEDVCILSQALAHQGRRIRYTGTRGVWGGKCLEPAPKCRRHWGRGIVRRVRPLCDGRFRGRRRMDAEVMTRRNREWAQSTRQEAAAGRKGKVGQYQNRNVSCDSGLRKIFIGDVRKEGGCGREGGI